MCLQCNASESLLKCGGCEVTESGRIESESEARVDVFFALGMWNNSTPTAAAAAAEMWSQLRRKRTGCANGAVAKRQATEFNVAGEFLG